jgi:hypothetical protein
MVKMGLLHPERKVIKLFSDVAIPLLKPFLTQAFLFLVKGISPVLGSGRSNVLGLQLIQTELRALACLLSHSLLLLTFVQTGKQLLVLPLVVAFLVLIVRGEWVAGLNRLLSLVGLFSLSI